MLSFLVVASALAFLMIVAYRGFSVILFAPIAAMGAVLLTDPTLIPPAFSGIFMKKLVAFVELYFPVFLLGAIFGKLIELSGFSKSIVGAVIRCFGREQAILSIVTVGGILTYGGVSLFVVVFAVYPFAAEMFRQSDIPKRLIPGTIALGSFTFTMAAMPGSPQIQNIIPTSFFGTTSWAAPWMGLFGSVCIVVPGIVWLEWRRRQAAAAGEGYGNGHTREPEPIETTHLPHPVVAIFPLLLVTVLNRILTERLPVWFGTTHSFIPAGAKEAIVTDITKIAAIWAVEGALIVGILAVVISAWRTIAKALAEGTSAAVSGAMLATLNTASEYGFGAVIASLPGFLVVAEALKVISDPLLNEALTVTSLAGITGSASGGMSIALAAMSAQFIEQAATAGIPADVLHRVAAMASGGMDSLPHNGAVITLLTVTGLSHRQSYADIFVVASLNTTCAVLLSIGFYYLTGIF